MTLGIADIVRVTAQITPAGVLRREFGQTLLLAKGPETIDVNTIERNAVRRYGSISDVAADYESTDEIYEAAQTYFSQNPYPKNLYVANWFEDGHPTMVVGGEVTESTVTALGATTTFTIAGENVTVDLSAATTLEDTATALQTAIRATSSTDLDDVTVEYSDDLNSFVLTVPLASGVVIDLGGLVTGADADALGLSANAGARYYMGLAEETVSEALTRIANTDDGWYFLALSNDIVDTDAVLDVAVWAEARSVILALDTSESAVLENEQNSLAPSYAAQLAALEYEHTFIVWSKTADHKALSLAALFSSVNFSSAGSLITGKFGSLPGTVPDTLALTEKGVLDSKRVNHYSPFGGINIVAEGTMLKPGTWIDVRYWLNWLVNATQVEVFSLLRSGRVPQTQAGVAAIMDVVERICEEGVANGGIAPGQVSPALVSDIRLATGNQAFDGFLSTGYLVHVGSVASQSQADRDARKSPPVRVWVKGSGAIHFIDIDVTFLS